jgi:hypothetical protein
MITFSLPYVEISGERSEFGGLTFWPFLTEYRVGF